jgi:hypothetical protein
VDAPLVPQEDRMKKIHGTVLINYIRVINNTNKNKLPSSKTFKPVLIIYFMY